MERCEMEDVSSTVGLEETGFMSDPSGLLTL